jgi:hypothetical protein
MIFLGEKSMRLFRKKLSDEDLGIAISRLCFTVVNLLGQPGGTFETSRVLGRDVTEIDWKEIVSALFFVGDSTAGAVFRSTSDAESLMRRAQGASEVVREAKHAGGALAEIEMFGTMDAFEIARFIAARVTEYAELLSGSIGLDQLQKTDRENHLRTLVLERALGEEAIGVDLGPHGPASDWMEKAMLLVATYVSELPSRFRLPVISWTLP